LAFQASKTLPKREDCAKSAVWQPGQDTGENRKSSIGWSLPPGSKTRLRQTGLKEQALTILARLLIVTELPAAKHYPGQAQPVLARVRDQRALLIVISGTGPGDGVKEMQATRFRGKFRVSRAGWKKF
jgi:hypothetical protein